MSCRLATRQGAFTCTFPTNDITVVKSLVQLDDLAAYDADLSLQTVEVVSAYRKMYSYSDLFAIHK